MSATCQPSTANGNLRFGWLARHLAEPQLLGVSLTFPGVSSIFWHTLGWHLRITLAPNPAPSIVSQDSGLLPWGLLSPLQKVSQKVWQPLVVTGNFSHPEVTHPSLRLSFLGWPRTCSHPASDRAQQCPRLWSQADQVQVLPSSVDYCVTSDKFLNLSDPQSPQQMSVPFLFLAFLEFGAVFISQLATSGHSVR